MLALTHPSPGAVAIGPHDEPIPGPHDLLVSVRASGLNRADLLQRAGKYAAPPGWPPDIPGMEYAGVVAEVGAGVSRWRSGDRVMGLVGGGSHAERLVVDERQVLPLPGTVSFTEGAAIPEAFMTAWDAMVILGRATHGSRVLMHAIGSGVGTAAVQLAHALGLDLTGTSRTADKLVRAASLGLTHGVLTTDADWPTQVGGPVDVIVDPLGATFFEQHIALLAPRGRLVVIGTMTGTVAPSIDLGQLLRRRLEIVGTAMRIRDAAEREALTSQFAIEVLPLFESGMVRPVVERVLPFAEAERAYDLLAGNQTFGKVILEMPR